MASTYDNDLRLEEMATGENSGSWGTKTNTNLELIADAFSYGTEIIADADTTIEIQDGAADAARSLALKINSSADLTTTRTITLAPNTTSKVWIIENNTSGDQVLTISAGSGTNVTLPNGVTKIIATDGIGAGSNVTELYTNLHNITIDGVLSLADGSNSAPSLTNTGDTNTGLYFPAADEVGLTVAGTQRLNVSATGIDVTGTVTMDGGSTSADFTFGANDKAIFGTGGASSQLQIYSDGSNSYVDDAGAGTLYIRGSRITFDKYTGETMVDMVPDGAVNLFYNNVNVFQTAASGVNVIGTVTADGFQTDTTNTTTNLLARDSSNAAVYIQNGGTGDVLHVRSGNMAAGQGDLHLKVANNGDIDFYATDGTTPAFHWDAADERLGLGTTSPSQGIHLKTASGNSYVKAERTTASQGEVGFNTDNWYMYQKTSGTDLHFYNGADRMTVDSSGNVGIGVVPEASYAPSLAIGYGGNNITSRGNADFRILSGAFQDANSTFQYSVSSVPVAMLSMTNGGYAFATAPAGTDGNAATFTNSMILDSSGNLIIGSSSADGALKVSDSVAKISLYSNNGPAYGYSNVVRTAIESESDGTAFGAHMNFSTNNTSNVNTERMQITSGGAVRIGNISGDGEFSVTNTSATDGNEIASFVGSDVNQRLIVQNYLCGSDEDRVGILFENQGIANVRVWMGDDAKLYSKGSNPTSDNDGRYFVQVNDSGNIAMPSGNGIDFSAVTGGTGTATGNVLDDYEEGTWSPGTSQGTISAQYAKYTKIGRSVTVSALIHTISDQSDSAVFAITDLPFTSCSTCRSVGAIMMRYQGNTSLTSCYLTANTTSLEFYGVTAGGWDVALHSDWNNANAEVYFTITYNADS